MLNHVSADESGATGDQESRIRHTFSSRELAADAQRETQERMERREWTRGMRQNILT
jgi:hypothetical protein